MAKTGQRGAGADRLTGLVVVVGGGGQTGQGACPAKVMSDSSGVVFFTQAPNVKVDSTGLVRLSPPVAGTYQVPFSLYIPGPLSLYIPGLFSLYNQPPPTLTLRSPTHSTYQVPLSL